MTPQVVSVMLFIFSLFMNDILSLPVCEYNSQNILNTSRCSFLHVSSVREIANHAWKGTRELLPDVEYWTDAMLDFTPWIQFSGCLETSKPQNVLEKLGTRLLDEHPITECLTYVKNSTFYLWGSRCVDQESVGTLTGGYCIGVPFNLTTLGLTGHQNCICRYDIVAFPTEPGPRSCKSISFSFGEDGNNTLNTALHDVNCDSNLPSLCVRRNNYGKEDVQQFHFFEGEMYNISIARALCSLLRFDMVSTVGMQYMTNDFRNHFINSSRSYWTSIFRENRFILCVDRHVYDHNSSYCISIMLDHNQTMVWYVRSCPLVIPYNVSCPQAANTIDSNVTSDNISYLYFLFVVPVIVIIVIIVCIIRRQRSKETSEYSYHESTRIHYTEQRVEGIVEERTDAEYGRTVETRIHYTEQRVGGIVEERTDAEYGRTVETPQKDVAMASQREGTHILQDEHEEPHYMVMDRPEESIYVSVHLRYPTNGQ